VRFLSANWFGVEHRREALADAMRRGLLTTDKPDKDVVIGIPSDPGEVFVGKVVTAPAVATSMGCGCKIVAGRWVERCQQHEGQFSALHLRALQAAERRVRGAAS
jgi:hypothetical protein